jgi:hypothetical protein
MRHERGETMRLITSFLLILIVIAPSLTSADPASHARVAEELLVTMDADNLLKQSISQMMQLQIQQNPQLGLYEKVLMRFFEKYMSWESLRPDFIDLYTQAFTEDELREILGFYKSQVGQKAVKAIPNLMAQGGQIGVKRIQDHLPELQTMIAEEIARLKKLQERQ